MTETQERFLRHIAERVPLDRVVEVHLFPAIRQGGVETGIAVIAARPEEAEPAENATEPAAAATAAPGGAAVDDAEPAVAPIEAAACDPTEDAAGPAPDAGVGPDAIDVADAPPGDGLGDERDALLAADAAVEDGLGAPPQLHDEAEPDAEPHHAVAALATALREPAADLPVPAEAEGSADDAAGEGTEGTADAGTGEGDGHSADRAVPIAVVADRVDGGETIDGEDAGRAGAAAAGIAPEAVAALIGAREGAMEVNAEGVAADAVRHGGGAEVRHTIFSARYRLTLRGVDRGKWEFDVVAEADAPLVAVDAVVRGVRQRSGEQSDAERVSGEALRRLAVAPA